MPRFLKKIWIEDEGQNLAEYALILALLSLVAVAALGPLAFDLSNLYSGTSTRVAAAVKHRSFTGELSGSSQSIHTAGIQVNNLSGSR